MLPTTPFVKCCSTIVPFRDVKRKSNAFQPYPTFSITVHGTPQEVQTYLHVGKTSQLNEHPGYFVFSGLDPSSMLGVISTVAVDHQNEFLDMRQNQSTVNMGRIDDVSFSFEYHPPWNPEDPDIISKIWFEQIHIGPILFKKRMASACVRLARLFSVVHKIN